MSNSRSPAQVAMQMSLGRVALAALALVAALASACTNAPSVVSDSPNGLTPTPTQSGMGTIDIALAVPPSFQIATVNYQISNTSYSRSGSLDVSQSQTISGVLGGIPAGTGYTLTLTATDTANKFTGCSGSAPLTVVGGSTTSVNIDVACHLPQPSLTTPAVPIPMSAVALLAVALLAVGSLTTGRRGARGPLRRD
jgi:hypothetical protein